MATYLETPTNTGTALAAMSANDVRTLWQKTVEIYEQTEDFFQTYEGRTMGYPIWEKTDTEKGTGQSIRITVRSGYYGEGKSGENLFETTTDYEATLIGGYNLAVDWLRHATSNSERMEELMGMRGEIASGDAAEQGKWMGRQKTARMMIMFREKGGTENLTYAGGQLDENDLVSADGLSWDEIVNAKAQLEPLGGRPAKVGRVNGQDVNRYPCSARSQAFGLKTDPDYKQALRESGVRGDGNQLFEGVGMSTSTARSSAPTTPSTTTVKGRWAALGIRKRFWHGYRGGHGGDRSRGRRQRHRGGRHRKLSSSSSRTTRSNSRQLRATP